MKRILGPVLFASLMITAPLAAQEKPEKMAEQKEALSLITATPDEGFALAVKLARRGVATIQTDKSVLKAERPKYSKDAESLIAASHVVAVHFQTIAAANNYWRQ